MTFTELIQQDKPVLVDFFATWCGPCQAMAPILSEVKEKVQDRAVILKIDIDKNQQLAQQLQVRGVPTLVLYKAGKQLWRQSGVVSASALLRLIDTYK